MTLSGLPVSCSDSSAHTCHPQDTRPQEDGAGRELLKAKSLHNIPWRYRSKRNKLETSEEPGFLILVLPELVWF